MVLNLLPDFYLLGWDFLVQMFYKQMLFKSCTCSGQNGYHWGGGGGGGGGWCQMGTPCPANSPALPDFIDETKTTKDNRI